MSRRVLSGGLALVVVLAALVLVGSWERDRRADRESSGIGRVVDEVGALDSPSLRGFRILVNFQCLVYERGRNDFALEVCVDDEGNVVEAIDRRERPIDVWSVRDDPTRSRVRVDRAEVDELLARMGVPASYLPTRSAS
jgi:hypothetical protein